MRKVDLGSIGHPGLMITVELVDGFGVNPSNSARVLRDCNVDCRAGPNLQPWKNFGIGRQAPKNSRQFAGTTRIECAAVLSLRDKLRKRSPPSRNNRNSFSKRLSRYDWPSLRNQGRHHDTIDTA